jgi:glycerol uptake facilitator-like aquaporin
MFGNVSGGVFNPAAAIGMGILGNDSLNKLWIYLAGPLAGGLLAGLVNMGHSAYISKRNMGEEGGNKRKM